MLYWWTVRDLRAEQIWGRVRRKRAVAPKGTTPVVRQRPGSWVQTPPQVCGWHGGQSFTFLGVRKTIAGWNDPSIPKLWLYNLHYQAGVGRELIERWMAENPPVGGNGWEPYPLSLRIGHWLRWIAAGNEPSARMLASLAEQARVLAGTVEWHLLGNHLFVNGKALLWIGTFFEGAEAEGWRALGAEILQREWREQILGDGGHFERSPMYHALATEDVLDLVNLEGAYGRLPFDVRGAAAAMLGWLEQLTHADGSLVQFNDTAQGVAPAIADLRAYAERLGVGVERRPLRESGFLRLEGSGTTVWMDAGSVGPVYQAGHAHAETLCIAVERGGRRIVGSLGISTYEKNEQRQRERGTGAHSTLRCDGQDSSEVWGGFRVARKAKVLRVESDGVSWAEAAHDGYSRLERGLVHERRVEIRDGDVLVRDRMLGRGRHRIEILFHLAPGEAGGGIALDPRLVREERPSEYHAGYGRSEGTTSVVGCWDGELPAEWTTVIRGRS